MLAYICSRIILQDAGFVSQTKDKHQPDFAGSEVRKPFRERCSPVQYASPNPPQRPVSILWLDEIRGGSHRLTKVIIALKRL